jgi:peptidoglycan/xylan/chitin deacetylase (PgdA/CDA1 family)
MPSIRTHRWLAKKIARRAAGAVDMLRELTHGPAGDEPVLRVLTYHAFGFERRDPFCLDPTSFDQQIRWLAGQERAVSLDAARDFLAGRRRLPEGAVLVTIDDGDAGIASHAWPILERHGVPAVAFIIAGQLGWPGRLTAAQVKTLAARGLEIGSHTLTHPSMARIPRGQARQEAEQSKRRLEDLVGRPVTSFAYPYGTLADFDPEVAGILAECGYDCAFTSQHGPARPGMPLLTLPRIKVEAGDPPWLFARLCDGAMDCWRLVDQALWRVQRPHLQPGIA